ncbi:MAG: DUF4855 domain-containing protein [Oscillospiraceae bacterium]|nr:DUF4855 domain-containing protein [Oscillospiraceae bacterium]
MKKVLSLLLALLMLALTLASCKSGEDAGSVDPSADSSADTESSGGSESSDDPNDPNGSLNGERRETVVSIGKPYTVSFNAEPQYEDSFGTELCDGFYADIGASYSDTKFAGFSISGKSLDIIFDMGEDHSRLYKFGISFLNTREAGIGKLGTSRIYYSNDLDDKWTRAGLFYVPQEEEGKTQQVWLTLDEPIDARYIRFSLKGTSSWLFLDELVIIADTAGSSLHANYLTQLDATYNGNHLSQSDLKAGSSAVDRTLTLISATKGKYYSTSYLSNSMFPDRNNALLTDGNEPGANLESESFAGYEGGKELTIDIPLKGTVEGLSEFSLSMFQQANLRYMLPYYVDFYISADGKTYDRIGRVYAPSDLSITNFTFALHLNKGFTAQAVRFVLAESDSLCFLVEEADASYYGVDTTVPLYPELSLPEVKEPVYKQGGSTKVSNLVKGLPYQITSGTPLEYATEIEHNTLADAGVLTDGAYSPNTTYNNGYWNRTRGGGSRSVYFDLGYNASITGFKIDYLQFSSYAIYAPSSTNLYLSVDGVNWYSAGVASCLPSGAAGSVPAELTLEKAYEARFICVSFACTPHAYADEIEIFGTEAVSSGTVKLTESDLQVATKYQYMKPSDKILGGVKDMALIYYGARALDEDFFLPYVAYLDAEGNIKDTLFDGYLFLPTVAGRQLPSGGQPHEASADKPTLLIDWMYQFEQDFTKGQHFDALNKTAAKVKEALSLPADYKLKVYATIMYPNVTATDFGDIDNDGVSEDLSKTEDRLKVLDLYMQMYLDRFAEEKYENLSLEGFYWFAESISNQAADVVTLPATAEIAKSKGTQIFWIPYYVASGYSNWNSFGFTAAYMQPNYVFKLTTPISQLYSAASLIKNLGMGVEIEVNGAAVGQLAYYRRYLRYLGYGAEAGYMTESIHAYYQDVTVFYDACYSGTEMGRSLYDATYGFIKGTLKAPEKLPDVTATCEKDGLLHGELLEGLKGFNTAELTVSAEHGSVTVDANGGYWYIPYEGFTGKDTFTFRYSDYLMWSAETTVTITVG